MPTTIAAIDRTVTVTATGPCASRCSPNIVTALRTARERGLVTIGFTGSGGEALAGLCDHLLIAPSDDTPIIQQIHLTVAHGICDEVEQAMMGEVLRK